MALWCRRLRAGSSCAPRMKRPATSQGTEEHGVTWAGGSGVRDTFRSGKVSRRLRCWRGPSEAWPCAGGGAAESIMTARISMLVRTSRLDAPISSCLSLMPTSTTLLARSLKKMSSAMQLSCWPWSSSSSWKSRGFCKHRATQHEHTIGGMSAAGPARRPANVVGRVVASDSQVQDVLAGKKQPEGGRREKVMHEGAAGRTFKRRCTEGSKAAAAGRRTSAWSFEGGPRAGAVGSRTRWA